MCLCINIICMGKKPTNVKLNNISISISISLSRNGFNSIILTPCHFVVITAILLTFSMEFCRDKSYNTNM